MEPALTVVQESKDVARRCADMCAAVPGYAYTRPPHCERPVCNQPAVSKHARGIICRFPAYFDLL